MRLQMTLTVKALEDDQSRHTDFYGLKVLVEPVRVTLQPNHLKAVLVLQSNIDQLKAEIEAAPPSQVSRASQTVKAGSSGSPWTGHLQVDLPVLRMGAVASPEEPESCILVLEAVTASALVAVGTAIGVDTTSAAEQAAAAAAVAAEAAAAAQRGKAAAAATAQDTEESVTALDFCLQLQARVGAIYADTVSINGPEEQETPVLEPTSIDLHVPAYQGLRTKRKVWLGKELLQAFCPQLAITWVNFHASEVNAAVLSRLYSCFELARQHNRRQGSVGAVASYFSVKKSRAVIAVPDQSGQRLSRMIARLPEEMGLPLDVAKRRARKVVTRVYRSRGTKQQRIAKSRSALLDTPGERKGPVRSMLPMIARAEDLVVGAGRVAKDAMKDTVKRSGEVFKELRKAAAAEVVISREVDEADELERVVTTGLRFGEKETQGKPENLGLGILPGWPLADMRAALRHRSRTCTVITLPLLPPTTWQQIGRDSLRDSHTSKRFSRTSKQSEEEQELTSHSTATEERQKSEMPDTEAGLYEDDDQTDVNSEYSRFNSGWSANEEDAQTLSPGSTHSRDGDTRRSMRSSVRSMASSLRSRKSRRSSQ
ncbi:unnamed protein product, partial [Cladocopium goreaui]